jgi:hypothetical protein
LETLERTFSVRAEHPHERQHAPCAAYSWGSQVPFSKAPCNNSCALPTAKASLPGLHPHFLARSASRTPANLQQARSKTAESSARRCTKPRSVAKPATHKVIGRGRGCAVTGGDRIADPLAPSTFKSSSPATPSAQPGACIAWRVLQNLAPLNQKRALRRIY